MILQKKKIVIIDDETDLGFLIKESLADEQQYEIFLTDDPEEGKNICLREFPDLVLVDYFMPKIYGNEVAVFLRANPATVKIKIIMMSGLVAIKDQEVGVGDEKAEQSFAAFILRNSTAGVTKVKFSPEQVAQYGVDAFLSKPFLRKDLLDLVRVVLKEK